MNFKNIIWDFDGTLFDTYPGMLWAFQKALVEEGVRETNEDVLKEMKISVTHAIEFYRETYGMTAEFVQRFRSYEQNIEVGKMNPFPCAKEICEAVKKGGGQNFIYTHRDESIKKYLEHHEMKDCFVEVITMEHGLKRKPDPDGFLYFINKYKLNKEETLGIGDRILDIQAAQNAGIKACYFNSDGVLKENSAEYKIGTLEEVRSVLGMV